MQIDIENSFGRIVANGRMMPEQAVEIATTALTEAEAGQVCGLILDLREVSLTRTLSITECHEVGERLARAGRGLCKVAFVTRAECMEPHQFVFAVARNRGLQVATFANETEAEGWLRA